ncbi:hypothetical protein [Amnibacterium sp.]|uniref:hypothetical protein n=1 Tax=Amnibacterium sp. TaxID=1872496 RepID=UPI00261439FC|nr:hypothetical protein [Amnibacterium sp.]MCU1472428.1 hypothetical protein [Amnibacterium sp.]
MQLQYGLLTAAATAGALVVFLVGIITFRARPDSTSRQLRATVTMWAGVVGMGGFLCCAATMSFPPF